MTAKDKQAWVDMAQLTAPLCAGVGKGACRVPHSCCDRLYCDLAKEYAKEQGEVFIPVDANARLPFMGEKGCVVPAHLRPLCTLHVCCINSIGANAHDMEWNTRYFKLRAKLEKTIK